MLFVLCISGTHSIDDVLHHGLDNTNDCFDDGQGQLGPHHSDQPVDHHPLQIYIILCITQADVHCAWYGLASTTSSPLRLPSLWKSHICLHMLESIVQLCADVSNTDTPITGDVQAHRTGVTGGM